MSPKEAPSTLGTVRDDDEREQRRRALRALVQMPLLTASGAYAEEFTLVRRHEDALKKWFSHHTGWSLQVATDFARLRKVPGDLTDATFPAREPKQQVAFTRRRYIFLCLALAALERNARQTTLSDLAGAIIEALEGEPLFAARGIALDLSDIHHRRDIVAVVRYIIERQVLTPRHGDEEQYIRDKRNNVLYSINRPVLSALLCVQRGPSTVEATACRERIAAVTAELTARTDEGRNRRLHHLLLRRLLEQPIVYYSDLSEGERDLLSNRRARLLQYIEEATGLVAEVRTEGIALLDESEDFTDLVLATEGTNGHATLLLAEFLAECARERDGETIGLAELHTTMASFIEQHRSRWRKVASQPGAETALTEVALERLAALQLVRVFSSGVLPMPAICRYRIGSVESEPTLL